MDLCIIYNWEKIRRKWRLFFIIFFLLPFVVSGTIMAEEAGQEEQVEEVMKNIIGRVVSIRSGHIDIVYHEDKSKGESWEVGFDIDEDVKIKRKRSFSDIEQGDQVSIKFVEKLIECDYENEDGSIERIKKKIGTEALEITFIKKKQNSLSSGF